MWIITNIWSRKYIKWSDWKRMDKLTICRWRAWNGQHYIQRWSLAAETISTSNLHPLLSFKILYFLYCFQSTSIQLYITIQIMNMQIWPALWLYLRVKTYKGNDASFILDIPSIQFWPTNFPIFLQYPTYTRHNCLFYIHFLNFWAERCGKDRLERRPPLLGQARGPDIAAACPTSSCI